MCENHSRRIKRLTFEWLFRVDLWKSIRGTISNAFAKIWCIFTKTLVHIECNYAMAKSNYSTKSISMLSRSCHFFRGSSRLYVVYAHWIARNARTTETHNESESSNEERREKKRRNKSFIDIRHCNCRISAPIYMHHRHNLRRKKCKSAHLSLTFFFISISLQPLVGDVFLHTATAVGALEQRHCHACT